MPGVETFTTAACPSEGCSNFRLLHADVQTMHEQRKEDKDLTDQRHRALEEKIDRQIYWTIGALLTGMLTLAGVLFGIVTKALVK